MDTPNTPADRPPGITCEKYVRGEGKRCRHYLANGGCSLPGEAPCSEWLKLNGERRAATAAKVPEPLPAGPALKPGSFLTRQDLASFRQLGAEVEIKSPLGTFWLVPARTGKDRLELTPEDALTLVNVVQVFGGRITSFAHGNTPLADAERKNPALPAATGESQTAAGGAEADPKGSAAKAAHAVLPPPAPGEAQSAASPDTPRIPAAQPKQKSLFARKDGTR